jgi:hypothetical protein
MFRTLCLCIAASAATALPALAAALAPSTILANPSSYDGKTVTVSGKVAKYQTTKTMMGTVAGFALCDAKCIVVIDERNSGHQNGDTVSVTGTFHVTFKAPHKSYDNAVVIK